MLPSPYSGEFLAAVGMAASDGSVLVLLGGTPDEGSIGQLVTLLPLLAASFKGELMASEAASQARLARVAAEEARALSTALADAHREVQHALAITERERQRSALVADVSELLTGSLRTAESLPRVARSLVPPLADCCAIFIGDQSSVPLVAFAHADEAVESGIGQGNLKGYTVRQTATLPSRVHFHSGFGLDLMEACGMDQRTRGLFRSLALGPAAVMPLSIRERYFGLFILWMSQSTGRSFDPSEADFLTDVGRRISLAVDNVYLHEETMEALRYRDEFLSVAAHELRTPLTVLQSHIQLTLRRLKRGFDVPQLQVAMETIQQQVRRLSLLVAQLLDTSRIQGGRLALDRHVTDLPSLLREAVADAQTITGKHRLLLRTPDERIEVEVDSCRLHQAVQNLLENAIKYSPDGGDIEVDLVATGDGTVRISVRDYGIGIPPEHRERVLERYHRAHPDRHFGGMGLGLYISRQIVEMHGGRIWVESPADVGTRFILEIPMSSPRDVSTC